MTATRNVATAPVGRIKAECARVALLACRWLSEGQHAGRACYSARDAFRVKMSQQSVVEGGACRSRSVVGAGRGRRVEQERTHAETSPRASTRPPHMLTHARTTGDTLRGGR